jgi:porin
LRCRDRLSQRYRSLGLLLASAALLMAGPALANDKSLQPGLSGDWNGRRTELKDQGWQFQVKGIFEGAYNPTGGDRHAATGAGEIDFAALADLGKLIGDDGGSLEIKITDRFGADLGAASGLDPLMQPQEIWGRGDIWRLTQLSFAQDLFDKKLNLEFGRLNPGSDFDVFACNFENLSFCGSAPGNIDGKYWFNSPVSQWGGRIKVSAADTFDLEAGLYQINQVNLKRGFSFDFGGGSGVLVPFEAEWKPKLFAGLPGDYQIGGWYSNMVAADVYYDINGDPLAVTGLPALEAPGRSGFFLSARQQVTGTAPPADAPAGTNGQGLTLFFNYTRSDSRTSMLDSQFALGAIYKGLLPGRADDEIALAFGGTHVNDRVAQGQILHNAIGLSPFEPVQHTEYVTELDYRWMIAHGAELSPNLQWIANPGGIRAKADALVLGLKATATL